jgi:hypothetical protein
VGSELDIDDVAAQSPLAKRQLEELRKDANRYQWLRDVGDETWTPLGTRPNVNFTHGVDNAIDAAMKKQAGKPINKQQPVLGHAANGFICPWDSEGRVCSQNKK